MGSAGASQATGQPLREAHTLHLLAGVPHYVVPKGKGVVLRPRLQARHAGFALGHCGVVAVGDGFEVHVAVSAGVWAGVWAGLWASGGL